MSVSDTEGQCSCGFGRCSLPLDYSRATPIQHSPTPAGMAGLRHKPRHKFLPRALGRVWWWAQNWAQSPRDHRERQVPGASACELTANFPRPCDRPCLPCPAAPAHRRARGTLALLSLGATLCGPPLPSLCPHCAASRLPQPCASVKLFWGSGRPRPSCASAPTQRRVSGAPRVEKASADGCSVRPP